MKFIKRIAKAIAGAITGALSLPVVQMLLLDSPIDWSYEYAIAGAVVGVSVYLIPNNGQFEKEVEGFLKCQRTRNRKKNRQVRPHHQRAKMLQSNRG